MLGKASLEPDHLPVSRFDLLVVGLAVPIHFVTLSGIEEEGEVVELPDRTKATGGRTRAVEFTASIPLHHTAEYLALEQWYAAAHDKVSPDYKRAATLLIWNLSQGLPRSFLLEGVWISRRALPDLDANNDGEMAVVEYTFQADNIAIGT